MNAKGLKLTGVQVGIPVLGVVENMSGLSQQVQHFKFFKPSSDGSQQDVTEQVLKSLPPELQVRHPCQELLAH